jgi:hypothetical protein
MLPLAMWRGTTRSSCRILHWLPTNWARLKSMHLLWERRCFGSHMLELSDSRRWRALDQPTPLGANLSMLQRSERPPAAIVSTILVAAAAAASSVRPVDRVTFNVPRNYLSAYNISRYKIQRAQGKQIEVHNVWIQSQAIPTSMLHEITPRKWRQRYRIKITYHQTWFHLRLISWRRSRVHGNLCRTQHWRHRQLFC